MTTRAQIIAEARTWIGTPFHHQARLKGPRGGVDCVGLLVGTAGAVGIELEDASDYNRRPEANRLLEELRARPQLEEIDPATARAGDMLIFWAAAEGIGQHVAFKTDLGIIHAYAVGGRGRVNRDPGRVVEVGLDDVWGKRIVAAFRFRDLED